MTSLDLPVLHIVKRYGPVGGMERYVWELTHALANIGVEVHVLCQEYCEPVENDMIQVHQLNHPNIEKPRWLSMLLFSRHVSNWVNTTQPNAYIIHSHERCAVHHITTFHSGLFNQTNKKKYWKLFSIRTQTWKYLEKREVCGAQVQFVLPNSDLIFDQLKEAYPCLGNRLHSPTFPATHISNTSNNTLKDSNIILFVGKEWKRKGLEKAIEIVQHLSTTKPDIEFWVLGPDPQEINGLFNKVAFQYKLLGWQNAEPFFSKARLLLHPASNEAYGMVIAEATASGIPVVISDLCGIASRITPTSGKVLSLNDNVTSWAIACANEIDRITKVEDISVSWEASAQLHISIYKKTIM